MLELLNLRNRLDVLCKARVFSEFELGMRHHRSLKFYRAHIDARTGGIEPRDPYNQEQPKKRSMAGYMQSLHHLHDSMRIHGFLKEYAIPHNNGNLLGGAHRLACALAMGIEPEFIKGEGKRPAWGWQWFEDKRFPLPQRMNLLHDYALVRDVSIFVLWGAYRDWWERFEDIISSNFTVVGSFSLSPKHNFKELVKDVYIREIPKAEALALTPCLRVVVCDAQHALATEIKKYMRHICGDKDYFSVHASDSRYESRHLAKTLCSWNNIRMLALRKPISEAFNEKLCGLEPSQDMCVVGGAAMEAVCAYKSSDIDVICETAAPKGVDVVAKNYNAEMYTDRQIVWHPDLHYYVRGVKFCNPEIVVNRKRRQGRAKDLKAVALYEAAHGK